MMTVETWKEMTGQQSTWFDTWLGFLEPQVVTTSALCAANPADPGNPSLALVVNAVENPSYGIPALLSFALDKMQYFEFTKVCVCNAPPATCTNLVPWTGTTGTSSFGVGTVVNHLISNVTGNITQFVLNVDTSWNAATHFYIWDASGTLLNTTSWPLPHNTGVLHLPVSGTQPSVSPGTHFSIGVDVAGQTLAFAGLSSFGGNPNISPNNACVDGTFGTYCSGSTAGGDWWFSVDVCTDAPAPVTQPTQPTDVILPTPPTCSTTADLCSILTQIQNQVTILNNTTNLYGRRQNAFAWIAGTPLTGLTGHGTLTVQDIIGITVTLTTIPAGWGFTADTPKRYIPTIGSIQATDGTVYDDWRQIHYANELFDIPSWATGVNYTLRPGVTATITPLSPEP